MTQLGTVPNCSMIKKRTDFRPASFLVTQKYRFPVSFCEEIRKEEEIENMIC